MADNPGVIPKPLSTLALGFALIANAAGAELAWQSASAPAPLLELFTSEGCSSCPVADQWLSKLRASPGLWKEVVPVAFHVDYWDHLGWRDPWSSKAFTDRQTAYAKSWGAQGVYTPGFVLQGREWRAWSRAAEIPKVPAASAGILGISSSDTQHWQVVFAPSRPGGGYTAHATLLACGLVSDVEQGENKGRRLDHDLVALALASVTLKSQRTNFQGQLSLALPKEIPLKQLAVAAWVTPTGRLAPLQAVGGWLVEPRRD